MSRKRFRKVLIANRGEIAVRIAKSLQQMGITAVGVHSDADRCAVHVGAVDEAYGVSGNTAAESYLRTDKIVDIARRCGAEAVHPGYGFLSENPEFARACADAGLVFIGPSPEAMRIAGDKVAAKEKLAAAGVPVAPGWSGGTDERLERVADEARRIGFPLLVKAAAGGGGKGMRVVREAPALTDAWEAAQREARAAFGDGRVFLERCIERPRHVEFQIFGDDHGNVVHLFERECSIQRRHQKIIEETPSPALSPQLRAHMADAAVRAARTLGYTNAGTVEFLLDDSGAFYFLEMNTRLQVEHPVTEMTLGLDLVRAQVQVASGEPLPFSQEELRPKGHAVECRVYAEDPSRGYLPSIGVLHRYRAPCGPNIRVDSGVAEGSEVTVHYDPMLAKLVCWGENRSDALDRTAWALERFVVLGVTTNVEFLRRLVNDDDFRAGRIHTELLASRPELGRPAADAAVSPEALIAAALAAQSTSTSRSSGSSTRHGGHAAPWSSAGHWRSA